MSRIPVQNLYYLLSYAWDLVGEAEPAPVAMDDSRSAQDMLAYLLAGGIEAIGRRGLFQDYQPRIEDTSRLKGRIDFVASVRRLRHRQASMVCHFDELGSDNLANGILRETLDRLLGSPSIDPAVKRRLGETADVLRGVPGTDLRRGCFRRAVITRHHRAYRFALAICEFLYELAQPDATGKSHVFMDPWSEKGMPRVFETFVRNFLRRHLPDASVTSRHLQWEAKGDTAEAQALIPTMKTDVTIEWGSERCMVLDCKFYGASFARSFDQDRLKSHNLYQMAAYLHHHPRGAAGTAMYGVLLYPTVGEDFLHQYDFIGHRLTIASLDLDQPWRAIHSRLLEVIDTAGRSGPPKGGQLLDQQP